MTIRRLPRRWLSSSLNSVCIILVADIFVTNNIEQPSNPPPIICINDRVLLRYAFLSDSVGFNNGHGLMFVGGKELGRVPHLAICQDKDSPQFTLYYCGTDWSPIGVASYDSVTAAERRAEHIYPGSSACWIDGLFTEDDADRYRDEMFPDWRQVL
jgi:hypothetical protein